MQNDDDFEDGDLSEMLNELRILLPGAQLLTAFLITLPFYPTIKEIVLSEKWVFIATFMCAVTSLIFFAAPAVQHRLMRPLVDRRRFKDWATHQILAGVVALSLALVLSANLVISTVFGHWPGLIIAILVASMVGILWWFAPLYLRKHITRR